MSRIDQVETHLRAMMFEAYMHRHIHLYFHLSGILRAIRGI